MQVVSLSVSLSVCDVRVSVSRSVNTRTKLQPAIALCCIVLLTRLRLLRIGIEPTMC